MENNEIEQALGNIANVSSRLEMASPLLSLTADLSELAHSLVKLGKIDEAIELLSVVHSLTKLAHSIMVE